jgi:hypothetical protein
MAGLVAGARREECERSEGAKARKVAKWPGRSLWEGRNACQPVTLLSNCGGECGRVKTLIITVVPGKY